MARVKRKEKADKGNYFMSGIAPPNKAHQLGQFTAVFGLRIRYAQFYANQTLR